MKKRVVYLSTDLLDEVVNHSKIEFAKAASDDKRFDDLKSINKKLNGKCVFFSLMISLCASMVSVLILKFGAAILETTANIFINMSTILGISLCIIPLTIVFLILMKIVLIARLSNMELHSDKHLNDQQWIRDYKVYMNEVDRNRVSVNNPSLDWLRHDEVVFPQLSIDARQTVSLLHNMKSTRNFVYDVEFGQRFEDAITVFIK